MGPALQLRAANRTDEGTLRTLHRALYVQHRDEILPPALADLYAYKNLDEALADDVRSLLQNPASRIFLAEANGETLGYITGHVERDLRRVLTHKGIVEDWYVLPEHRGLGVGRRLFEELISAFREAGCQAVESATWPFNTGARAVHDHLGFHEIQVRYRKRL
ncbi:MAG: GNAT family N-acetyltransferase [Myxococcales bacterium]|nr:GNAT family N-acetyltransferase [Myxococcales bacterium]